VRIPLALQGPAKAEIRARVVLQDLEHLLANRERLIVATDIQEHSAEPPKEVGVLGARGQGNTKEADSFLHVTGIHSQIISPPEIHS
jgi:hypothetical protein